MRKGRFDFDAFDRMISAVLVSNGEGCVESDGRAQVVGTGFDAHTVMVGQTGVCPWCGQS